MDSREEMILIQKDKNMETDFIEKYMKFITSSVYKATGSDVSREDDEFCLAIAAFNDAIMDYEPENGDFYEFAQNVIYDRLTDEFGEQQNENEADFSESEIPEEDNTEEPELQIPEEVAMDISFEIDNLNMQLRKMQISFLELCQCSPKTKKNKREVFKAIEYIVDSYEATERVLKDGVVPISKVMDNTSVSRKVLEEYRKYIIMGVVVLTGDYPLIAEYLYGVEEV